MHPMCCNLRQNILEQEGTRKMETLREKEKERETNGVKDLTCTATACMHNVKPAVTCDTSLATRESRMVLHPLAMTLYSEPRQAKRLEGTVACIPLHVYRFISFSSCTDTAQSVARAKAFCVFNLSVVFYRLN